MGVIEENKMRVIFKAAIIVLCLSIQVLSLCGKNVDKGIDQILVINAYTEATPWSNSLIYPVVSMVAQDSKLGVYTEHLNILMIDDDEKLASIEENIFQDFSAQRPKVIILIGVGSYMLCGDLDRHWPGVPMILCGERDYTGPKEMVLKKQALPPDKRIPESSLRESYNLTLLQVNIYIEKSIQLMKRMIPDMNKVLYIGDETYICQQNDYDLSRLIRQSHPDLEYQFISAKDVDTDSLFTILDHVDIRTTGILFSSWFRKKSFADNTIMTANSHRIIATSSVPLFSFKDVGIDEEGGIVGGYVHNKKEYIEQLLSTMRRIIDGEEARNIPFYYMPEGTPVFNYQSLVQRKLDPALCPSGSVFYNMPPTFWEEFKPVIGIFLGLLIVLLFIFQYHRLRMMKRMKNLQQKQLQANIRYHDLVDNMPILYMYEELIRDKAGKVVDTRFADVNRFFENQFFKREEVVGKTGYELFPESMPEFLYFINIVVKERRSVTFSYYYKSIDTFYDIVLNADKQGNFVDVFCVDTTELHHVQMQLSSTNRKLALALEVANIVPWKWDLQTHTILCDVNKPIELSHADSPVNAGQLAVPDRQYFSKIHREDLEKVQKAYADLIEGHITKVKEEYRVINHKDGHWQIDWVEAQAAVEARDEYGKALALVGSSLVITERKKIEEELLSAKDRAEESNRLKSAFLANMSHEIRTPLNAIVGFSGILASAEGEEEKQEYVNIIESNNTLLLQLISDILDLSKIEAGTMEFVYSDFELNKMLEELVDSLRLKLMSDRKVALIFEPGLPECQVYSERNRLSQLVINLVTNAIKFTEEGSIRLGYELRDNHTLYFYVTDTGCGIPMDKQESIFGRFVKLNNFAQGTGLGLSICQMLVQHMGGKIGVDSKPGEGATFWFTIPYAFPTNHSKQEEVIEPLRMEKKMLTILMAEDNPSSFKLMESILKKDYRLIHAWNGQEAVALFQEYAPQLILMDINMPVMDGYEATREIRKISAKVPIIAVTAFAYTSDEQRAMENGFDAFMSKPINAGQLKSKITTVLQRHIVFL